MSFLLILTIFLSLCISAPSIAIAQPLQFHFADFPYSTVPNLTLSGSSGLSVGALQITFDSGRNDSRKYYNMGRILYNKQFRLWDSAYNHTASFNTSFAINMSPADQNGGGEDRSSGGGMAFIMVCGPTATYCPGNCSEEQLGLFNRPTQMDGFSNLSMVAIEFDTFKNSFDPDDNHVGIDFKSIKSNTTASVDNATIDLKNGNTSVWIDYDGRAKRLDVYLAKGEKGDIKPVNSTLSVDVDLREHLEEQILFGFSGSTGSYFETHCVLRWDFSTKEAITVRDSNGSGKIIGLGIAAGVTLLVLMATAVVVTHKVGLKRVQKKWPDLTYGPRKFMYTELKTATDNFNEKNKLAKGGFGTVYKGNLKSDNTLVAVKRVCPKSSQGEQEFIAEVTTIGRLRHKNLLPLVGWYHDQKGKKLLLVYEYMPNGSLDKWLFTPPTGVCLSWPLRYKIVHGLARALLYLHEDWEQVVVHRDVKASNVMLDSEHNARLGDFGLARFINDPEDEMTGSIAGTFGYMAPECTVSGIVTPESDVYSFGAVALEVACGLRPYTKATGFLAHAVWQLHTQGKLLCAADARLEGAYDEDEMQRLLMVGLACCNSDPQNRPSIRKALQWLSKNGPLPRVPDSVPGPYSANPPVSLHAGSPSPWNSESRLLLSSPSDHSAFLTVTQLTVGR